MKISQIIPLSILSVALFSPVIAQADNFKNNVKAATLEIDKAKAENYEWKNSRKMLKEAAKLHAAGKNKKANKLVAQAKLEGQMAVKQAADQKGVTGAR